MLLASRFDTRARETPATESRPAVIGRVTRREFCGNGAATRSLINNEHVPATSSWIPDNEKLSALPPGRGPRPEEGAGIRWTHGYTVHDNAPATTFCPRPTCFSPPARGIIDQLFATSRPPTPPALARLSVIPAALVRGLPRFLRFFSPNELSSSRLALENHFLLGSQNSVSEIQPFKKLLAFENLVLVVKFLGKKILLPPKLRTFVRAKCRNFGMDSATISLGSRSRGGILQPLAAFPPYKCCLSK